MKRVVKKGKGLPSINKGLFENNYEIMKEFLDKRNKQYYNSDF